MKYTTAVGVGKKVENVINTYTRTLASIHRVFDGSHALVYRVDINLAL